MTAPKPLPPINPCPFCGSKRCSALNYTAPNLCWLILCSNCFARGPEKSNKRNAIKSWNNLKR